jgi:hypothetical protein
VLLFTERLIVFAAALCQATKKYQVLTLIACEFAIDTLAEPSDDTWKRRFEPSKRNEIFEHGTGAPFARETADAERIEIDPTRDGEIDVAHRERGVVRNRERLFIRRGEMRGIAEFARRLAGAVVVAQMICTVAVIPRAGGFFQFPMRDERRKQRGRRAPARLEERTRPRTRGIEVGSHRILDFGFAICAGASREAK